MMDESIILAAFLNLAHAAEVAATDLKHFNRFALEYDRDKKRQRLQAYLNTRRTSRRK